MPEALADDHDVDASSEHERGLAVAQVVEADPSEAALVDELGEAVGEPVGVQGHSVWAGEHEVVVLVGLAERRAGEFLPDAVGEQHADGVRVEVDDAVLTAGGLGPAERDAPVVDAAQVAGPGELRGEGDDLLADVEPVAVEVDVGPPQACCFASS